MSRPDSSSADVLAGSSLVIGDSPARPPRWAAALVAGVVFLTFARACFHDFTWWDDAQTIHQNDMLRRPFFEALRYFWSEPQSSLYVPVTYTAWLALARLARLTEPELYGIDLNPWIFHAASVIAHAAAAAACFHLLLQLSRRAAAAAGNDSAVTSPWPAVLGALVFGLHPVQVESVAWASGLKDVLAGLFGLLALRAHGAALELRAHDAPRRTVSRAEAGGLFLFAAAVLSKPSAAMIAPVAAVIAFFFYGRSLMAAVRGVWPWLLVTAAGLLAARVIQTTNGIEATPLWARPLVVGEVLTFYGRQLAFPLWLANDYGMRPSVLRQTPLFWAAWLAPASVAVGIAFSRSRPLMAAGLIFVLAPLPVLGLVDFQYAFYSIAADHYLYTAMLAPALAAAWTAWRFPRTRWALGALLVIWSCRSIDQIKWWQSDRALWTRTLAVNPQSFQAELGLAQEESRSGNRQLAIPHLLRAIAIQPLYVRAYRNLGLEYLATGRPDLTDEQFRMMHEKYRVLFGDTERRHQADEFVISAQAFLAVERPAYALHYLDEALNLEPGDTRLSVLRTALLEKIRPTPDAVPSLDRP